MARLGVPSHTFSTTQIDKDADYHKLSDEAETLMQVQTQLISPRYGLSVIGCNQDAISGNYLLTQKDYKVPYETAVDMLMAIGETDFARLPKNKEVSGKEIFSVLLPTETTLHSC